MLVCTIGNTGSFYDTRCVDGLYKMLKARGARMDFGAADEQKPAKDNTVEGWARRIRAI